MTNSPRSTGIAPELDQPSNDEGSRVRERVASPENLRHRSDPNISLGERLESKLAEANALLRRLEPQDARARLIAERLDTRRARATELRAQSGATG